jgi:hypothetical protein
VPTRAVTLGLRTLLGARRILLLVSGASKHAIVRRALEGPVGRMFPRRSCGGAGIGDRARGPRGVGGRVSAYDLFVVGGRRWT